MNVIFFFRFGRAESMEWKRAGSLCKAPLSVSTVMQEKPQSEQRRGAMDLADVDIDLREVYLLIVQFLSAGPCKRSFEHLLNELLENQLLPRRYHAWFSRSGTRSGNDDDVDDDGISLPLSYDKLVERYIYIFIFIFFPCFILALKLIKILNLMVMFVLVCYDLLTSYHL